MDVNYPITGALRRLSHQSDSSVHEESIVGVLRYHALLPVATARPRPVLLHSTTPAPGPAGTTRYLMGSDHAAHTDRQPCSRGIHCSVLYNQQTSARPYPPQTEVPMPSGCPYCGPDRIGQMPTTVPIPKTKPTNHTPARA
jgi:hypothetical protein